MLMLVPAHAAVPFAAPEEDRKAKQAAPPGGKALLYIYRTADNGPAHSPTLLVNNRDRGWLAKQSYYMWTVDPGRIDLRTDGPAAPAVSLRAQDGRIYFVRLTVTRDGSSELRQVSYGAGRQEVHRARLLREPVVATAEEPDRQGDGSGFTLILKGGSVQLGSDSQTILGLDRSFSSGGSAFGLEGEWRLANGLAFGGEIFSHAHEYTNDTLAGDGEMTGLHVMFNAKKYFRTTRVVQPYVGAGLGAVTASFSAGSGASITGSSGGYAFQAMGGVAFRWQHVGFYTELKLHKAEAEDADGNTVDLSGSGLFAGLSVHF